MCPKHVVHLLEFQDVQKGTVGFTVAGITELKRTMNLKTTLRKSSKIRTQSVMYQCYLMITVL